MQEARASGEGGLAKLVGSPPTLLLGHLAFLLGQIAEKELRHHVERQWLSTEGRERYEQAISIFEELHETSALASASQHLASLLEYLQKPEEALVHWKRAYLTSRQ